MEGTNSEAHMKAEILRPNTQEMERASSENNDQEQDKFAVQLVVTEEQRFVIEGVCGHYNWNYR